MRENISDITPEVRQAYLREVAATGLLCRSAFRLDFWTGPFKDLRKKDPEFDTQVKEALALYGELLEAEAHRRGVDGWEEPVFFHGAECGRIKKHDGRLLELKLKRFVPEYRERVSVDAALTGGVLIVNRPAASAEEWVQRAAEKS